ncbi:MAG: ATP-binding protein [Myxococcota bacterium]
MTSSADGLVARLRALPNRIWVRFLAVHLLLVAVPVAGISFARFYEREMLRAQEQDMVHQAEVLRQMLLSDETGLRLPERSALLRDISEDTRARLRLLDAQGNVVADSYARWEEVVEESGSVDGGVPAPSTMAARVEIQRALEGRYGSHMRFGTDTNLLFLCSALPIMAPRTKTVLGVVYVTRSTTPVWAAMHRLRISLLRVLLASLLFSTIISLFLATTISRPLSRLTRVATAIARGDRSQRLHLDRPDEIGELARAFDVMAHTLDERARYVAELSANISHEFKSPLTSMRGAAELLLEGAADDPAARTRFLRNILGDVHRLDRLVTRLLELSRVEAAPELDEVLDYRSLVEAEVARRNHPSLRLEYVSRCTRLRGHRGHLASALGNLVDNAVQHATPGTPITVRVDDVEEGLRTSVHNHGPAISPANLPRIWDRFFTTRSEQGGTGLGLPIVASVMRAHGGTVGVVSTVEAGTTFSFQLPRVEMSLTV